MMRLSPDEEHKLFLSKCKQENIEPTKELFEGFKNMVALRQEIIQSEAFKGYQKEKKRRQQRTVDQTINEDGAIISPLVDKQYVTKRS